MFFSSFDSRVATSAGSSIPPPPPPPPPSLDPQRTSNVIPASSPSGTSTSTSSPSGDVTTRLSPDLTPSGTVTVSASPTPSKPLSSPALGVVATNSSCRSSTAVSRANTALCKCWMFDMQPSATSSIFKCTPLRSVWLSSASLACSIATLPSSSVICKSDVMQTSVVSSSFECRSAIWT